ncbi:hypothetical protein CA235_07395 [Sphingomonas sp. ABOLF]|uniref:hypothetical protein n=1 Tax=Sphingomonas sp. ABOLF TaxID=1985879 RepID=UPI000F7E475E|nr:hypothetical protein [Sphingomonas sp. ABOLF]RSV15669.1 hypothetical protein CA235_07395 [Sphingomonas sp. ABOLF]
MPIPEQDFPFLTETRALAFDEAGRAVLRGLTYDETEEYLRALDVESSSENDRFNELGTKHERARIAIISAENEARHAGPAN